MTSQWQAIDNRKEKSQKHQRKDQTIKRRKTLKRRKVTQHDAFLHEEGTHYKSGAFHNEKTVKKNTVAKVRVSSRKKTSKK